ncbi:MAG: peptidase [Candidatus Heimdallarchaeota archaeon]|nr:peptidase [Candidatus Heimdallarchaeota archaeon]
MFPSLTIFYDTEIDRLELDSIVENLKKTYGIEIKEKHRLKAPRKAYNKKRKQYDGQYILNNLIDKKNYRFFVWITHVDVYVPVMNFVFGLASQYYGAIISFFRLENNAMKLKESIHEVGHLLGLSHCSNFCVMQYSNTLEEALLKPKALCDDCKRTITSNKEIFEINKD